MLILTMEDKDRSSRLHLRQKDRVTKELVRRLGVHNLALVDAALKQADLSRDFEAVVEQLYAQILADGVKLPFERALPKSLKGNVHDEWAAVARHQDDLQRLADYDRVVKFKDQQQRYKLELDALVQSKRNAASERHLGRQPVKALTDRNLKLTSEYRRGDQHQRDLAAQFRHEGLEIAAAKHWHVKRQSLEEQQLYRETLEQDKRSQEERDRQAAEAQRRYEASVRSFNEQKYTLQRERFIGHTERQPKLHEQVDGHREFTAALARQEGDTRRAISEKQRLAAEMAEQLRQIRAEDEAERHHKRALQQKYCSQLDHQAIEQQRVKEDGWRMSDTERRLNQDDLYNYTSRSPRLTSKVPGLGKISIGPEGGLMTPRNPSMDSVFTRQASSIIGRSRRL
jgi:hypothetical protein